MTRDPVHTQPFDPAPEPPEPDAEGGASRRAFLAGASAATVAGAAVAGGLVALAPAAAAATTTTSAAPDARAPRAGGDAVVAYVRDAAGGEVRLMSGEREVVVHDRALARTLTRHFDQQEG